jgi:hypothetical protein
VTGITFLVVTNEGTVITMADQTLPRLLRHDSPPDRQRRASLWAKWVAVLRTAHLDRHLAVAVTVTPGSALAVRAARVTSRRHREALARRLCRTVRVSRDTTAFRGGRTTLHGANIDAARPTIDDIVARLRAPERIDARGVARVHRILADGSGPLYRYGRGDLVGRLGAARRAM